MGLAIAAQALRSRTVRRTIAGGSGLRRINLTQSIANTGKKGFFDKIFEGLGKFWGFLTKWASRAGISFSGILSWLVQRVEELKAFDWNATDAELQQAIQGYNVQMGAIWGAAIGRGLGHMGIFVVGAGVGMVMPVIGGAALAGAIATAVAKNAIPDLLSELGAALKQTIALKARQATISAYINIRHFIKKLPVETLAKLPFIDAKFAQQIKEQWGAEGAPVLSFNKLVDDKVEQIKNPVTKAFVENLLEEAWDTFIEGAFVVAQELDSFTASSQLQRQQDRVRAVEVLPDRQNPNERLRFYGRENSLMGQITSTLNTHQILGNRDVGFFEQGTEQEAIALPQKRRLKVILYSAAMPPWKRPGKVFKKSEYAIPDPKSTVDWRDVKRACGGAAGLKVGRFYAVARFANRRRMTVYGDTRESAIANLERLADLSESNILSIQVAESVRSKRRPKDIVTVYGAFIHVSVAIPDPNGREGIDGTKYREERERIPLWVNDPPGNRTLLFKPV